MAQFAETEAAFVQSLAEQVRDLGLELRLPYVAASADIGDPEPMRDAEGRPFVETLFRWLDPRLEYWKDRGFALRSPFVFACRYTAEPFYFQDGRFGAWRRQPRLEQIEVVQASEDVAVGSSIIAPAHMPGGVIGAIVWASPEVFDIRPTYERRAAELHALTLKLLSAYNDLRGRRRLEPVRLTRREIQCLKWAAEGKTDSEIGQIMDISTPTVRFHMRNAAEKMGVTGRPQAVRRAAGLGYLSERWAAAR
jgi:DNA-binding CsgD family transcriptional regulator